MLFWELAELAGVIHRHGLVAWCHETVHVADYKYRSNETSETLKQNKALEKMFDQYLDKGLKTQTFHLTRHKKKPPLCFRWKLKAPFNFYYKSNQSSRRRTE